MRVVLLTALLCTCVSFSVGLTNPSPFSSDDAASLEKALLSQSLFVKPSQTHHILSSLATLSSKIPNANQNCDRLKSQLASTANGVPDVATVYHSLAALDALNCGGISISPEVKAKLQRGLDAKDLTHIYHAFSAVQFHLIEKKRADSKEFDFATAIATVIKLAGDHGEFKHSKNDASTAWSNGFGWELLSNFYKLASESQQQQLRAIAEKAENQIDLAGGDEEGSIVFSAPDRSSVAVTGQVFLSFLSLVSAFPQSLDLGQALASRFATFFLRNKYSTNPEDAFFLVRSLQALSSNNFAVPVVVSLTQSRIKVTNVLDKVVHAKVTISTVVQDPSYGSDTVASDVSCTPSSDQTFHEFSLNTLARGLYHLHLTVEPQNLSGAYRTTKVVRLYRVLAAVSGAECEVMISSASDINSPSVDSTKVAFPKKGRSLTADSSKYLHVRCSLTGNDQPSQVFVALIHSTGHQVTVSAKLANNYYERSIDFSSTAFLTLAAGSGSYSLNVIVGDAAISNPFSWEVCKLELSGLPFC